MKAAVLLVRLTRNHALPDGNKRTALATTIAFCDVNGFDWLPPAGDDPDGEETYQQRPARILRPSKPRSRPGSASGCTSVGEASLTRENICRKDVLWRCPPIRSIRIPERHLAPQRLADGAHGIRAGQRGHGSNVRAATGAREPAGVVYTPALRPYSEHATRR
jgi:hypothetical protein